MFNLLFRFWPRKSVGTPNASAPTAREVVLIKSRRLTPADETDSRELNRGIFLADCAFATGSTGRGERGGSQRRAGRFRHRPQRTGTGDWHHFRHIPFQVLCGRDTDGVLHTAASQRLVKAITLYCGPRGARSIGKRPTTLQTPGNQQLFRLPIQRMELISATTGEALLSECRRTAVMPGVQADTVRESVAPGQTRLCAAAENREGPQCAAHPRIGLRAPPRCRR